MRRRVASALRRVGALDAVIDVRDVGRAARSRLRALIWAKRLSKVDPHGRRFVITRQRAGVWCCRVEETVDPIEIFVDAFEQCLAISDQLTPDQFSIIERDGGAYPALEMTEQAWRTLVHRWHDAEAPWNLHVQRSTFRSRPECVRAASRRTADTIAGYSGRVIVFAAVTHPTSPVPIGRRLGVDVYVRTELEEAPTHEPWGELAIGDWVRKLRTPPFPIDAVYTWVDDNDPAWLERRAASRDDEVAVANVGDSASDHRFANRDELRYSLRSIALYAEWFDRVCVVTDRQVPEWASSSLEIVDHSEILDAECLPTFNSHAIETGLHRVPGLSEHYIYLNDDVFFDAPAPWSKFFTEDGRSRFFPSKALIPDAGHEETTIDHATSNGRELVHRQFGTVIENKMKHTPHAQRRSVHEWMETAFGPEHRATAVSRFRSTDDQSFASFLHHYVGVELGRAEAGHDLRYDYFNAADGRVARRLRSLRDRPGFFTTYCINDGDVAVGQRKAVDALIHAHLNLAIPFPSRFESITRPATSGLAGRRLPGTTDPVVCSETRGPARRFPTSSEPERLRPVNKVTDLVGRARRTGAAGIVRSGRRRLASWIAPPSSPSAPTDTSTVIDEVSRDRPSEIPSPDRREVNFNRFFGRGVSRMPIFCFWEPRDSIPPYLQLCMQTWKAIPDSEVVLLDRDSMGRFFDNSFGDRLERWPIAQQADVIRFAILESNAGVWMDLDTIIYHNPVRILSQLSGTDVLVIGVPERSAFMGFLATTRPHTAFFGEVLEEKIALVNSPHRPEPLPWDYLGKPFYSRVAQNDFCGSKATVVDWREHQVILEAIHGSGYGHEHYRSFWFDGTRDFTDDMVAGNSGLVMLHNSWTPPEYRSTDANTVLTSSRALLSQHLRYALLNQRNDAGASP